MNIPEMVAELRGLADKLEAGISRARPSGRPADPTLGFIYDMLGMDRVSPTPVRDANLNRVDQDYANAYHGGIFPVSMLSTADKAYLARVVPQYFARTGRDIMRDGIVSGGHTELNQARGEGEAWRNNFTDDQANPALRAEVERRLR